MKLFTTLFAICLVVGCGFSKKEDPVPHKNISEIEIRPEDWILSSGEKEGVSFTAKSLRVEKRDYLRKNFRTPSVSSVTVPESSGFELYDLKGYPELEKATYIHPKLFISSGGNQGSILGFKSKSHNPAGSDNVTISVPVALVNGLVDAIPVPGAPTHGASAAISLPQNFRIENPKALKERVSRELKTLPVCPKSYRLQFEGKQYTARPTHRSYCPINQFFRVEFEASTQEMRRLLETAAIREEAVSILTSHALPFQYPVKHVEVAITSDTFKAPFQRAVQSLSEAGSTKTGEPGYPVSEIESVISETLMALARRAGLHPQLPESQPQVTFDILTNYFTQGFPCHDGRTCRALLPRERRTGSIRFNWLEEETLATTLETQTITYLGAVANSSRFQARPSHDALEKMRRPAYFRNARFQDIVKECETKIQTQEYPGKNKSEQKAVQNYCETLASHYQENVTDGYYPLGNNTVVYPGAWLRIDIDHISEFTTAKTRQNKDGSTSVASQVVDLFANEDPSKRTTCNKGARLACGEFKKKLIEVVDNQGTRVRERTSCPKSEEGVNGCRCEKQAEKEVCFREGQYQYQEVLDYSCDAKDEFTYCPYWRTEEQVVDYTIQYDCQSVKTESHTNFLCIGGCSEKHELQCKEKSRTPIKAMRQVLNCIEDEKERIEHLRSAKVPEKDLPARYATASRVTACRRPQYRCARWENNCTQYSVNEAFHVVHEEVAPNWRPFAVEQGEYPARFEEDIYLKFVSRNNQIATNCRLNRFPRELRGSTLFIKIPSERNEEIPCDGPIWTTENVRSDNLPKVYIKNAISYPERRLCGKTEYSFITRQLPLSLSEELVPGEFQLRTEVRTGPVDGACTADAPFRVGPNLWFTEHPLIRFSGRVSVLGRMLETILTENR